MRVTILLIIFLSFQLPTTSAQNCATASNIFTFKFQTKKYEIIKEKKTWIDAASCAVMRGGYLVQLNSKAEQDSLYYQIKYNSGISSTYTSVNDGGGAAYIWIGATDKKSEGIWLWDGNNDNSGANFWNGQGGAGTGSGTAANGSFINWGGTSNGSANEPDNYLSNQNAAGIALASWPYGIAGEWNDIDITNTLYYVIEYDSSAATGFNQLLLPTNDLCLYPNPAKQQLNITTSQTLNPIVSIEVYNTVGAILRRDIESRESTITLDVSGIETGMYFVNIQFVNGATLTKKFILNR